MSVSKTVDEILVSAAREDDRLRRHFLVAAALREILSADPIVVGGLAEDYYTDDRYRPTDLDMCAPVSEEDVRRLEEAGFERDGRHWYHDRARVAVEFPDDRIDGDESRTLIVELDVGSVRLIGIDDLYLDRLRQATMTEVTHDIAFVGALAIATSRYEDMDWRYVRRRLLEIRNGEPLTGESMVRLNRQVRRRARSAITG